MFLDNKKCSLNSFGRVEMVLLANPISLVNERNYFVRLLGEINLCLSQKSEEMKLCFHTSIKQTVCERVWMRVTYKNTETEGCSFYLKGQAPK